MKASSKHFPIKGNKEKILKNKKAVKQNQYKMIKRH